MLVRAVFTAAVVLGATAGSAADMSGVVYHDRDGDGVIGAGDVGLGATIEVFGQPDIGGPIDLNVLAAPDGTFVVSSADIVDGCYATRVTLPYGFRLGRVTGDCPGSSLGHPVGTRRYGAPRHLIDHLRASSLLHVGLGDSIAEPASFCTLFPLDTTDYLKWMVERLRCIAPGALNDNNAIGGKETFHLLAPAGTCEPPLVQSGPDRCDNVFDAVAKDPQLVTISIGGNDWLGTRPTDVTEPFDPAEVAASIDALIDARRNTQEILAYLATELPTTDVIFNTVYDNSAYDCSGDDYNDIWVPIWNQMMRDAVWGHGERFGVSEVYPEYAHLDTNGADCCGDRDRVCSPALDGIHPTEEGAEIHLEKVWEAAGGVNLGPKDGIGAGSNPDLTFAAEQLVAVRSPTLAEPGAGVVDPDAALVRDGRGALVAVGRGELVVRGFDAMPRGITPTRMVVVVRYRTVGSVPALEPDAQVFDAAIDGLFRPPEYTVVGWDTVVPILGAGSNAPQPNALSAVPDWREVRATLTRNLDDDGRVTGHYRFSRIDWIDVETLAIRFQGRIRAAEDAVEVEWDGAWIEVYGTRSPGLFGLHRTADPSAVADPSSLVDPQASAPYEDLPPRAPVLYYGVDDGAGQPGVIQLVRRPHVVALHW